MNHSRSQDLVHLAITEGPQVRVPFVADELNFLRSVVPLDGVRVLDIGCGDGAFARRLLRERIVRSAIAIEAEPQRHLANIGADPIPGLTFVNAGADDLPLEDSSIDVAIMLKSLHHVPIPLLGQALREIWRVLANGGYLYVSEPVYAGEFNEVMRLFHDERTERAAAYAAIHHALQGGNWAPICERIFETALEFRDFDNFLERMVYAAGLSIPASLLPEVRNRFSQSMGTCGARFVRQLRVNVLRKTAPARRLKPER